ncbi:hypothetical protein BD324DRAFT_305112 [Kockovaella imperatae]|uniref:Uncharacterized protein n=1 Tax=Kockovaella imperatae TaxID=4999 RepID=A0A1Y1ULU5_9TREE|nr:hypothetical protein BD324DRAFT_305112 [Kockovaella imperatae]ORX39028.1 hypothetical protein BD324DRAFT_305112 [Kockovaella imperatae]
MALGVRVVSNTTTHPNKAFWEASLLVAILLVVLLVSLCSWGGGWLWGNSDGSSPRKPRSDPPTSTGAPASTPSPPGAPPQDPPDSPTTPPGTSPRSTDSSGTDSDSGGSHDDEEDGTRSPGNAVNSRVPPGFNAQTYHLPGGNTVILRTPIDETDREGRTTTITTGGMNRPVTDGQGGRSAYIPFEVPRSSFPGNTTFAQQQGRPAQSGASPAVQLPPSQQQHPAPPGEPRAVNLPPVTPLSPNVIVSPTLPPPRRDVLNMMPQNLQPTIRHTPVNVSLGAHWQC